MSNIRQHPKEVKKILQAARQLRRVHKQNNEIIPKGISKAKSNLNKVKHSSRVHFKNQSYDTEYHFYARSIKTGKYKNIIKIYEKAINAAESRLKDCEDHIEHWKNVLSIYRQKYNLKLKTIKIRKDNLIKYKNKCQKIAKKFEKER